MRRMKLSLLLLLSTIAACDHAGPAPSVSAPGPTATPPMAAPVSAASAWAGKWTGPEGTYLEVSESGQQYSVSIRNLDGVRTFEATSTVDALTFERDGTRETLRAGNGKDTGMKWLQDKSDCLVVKAGEGYCRG